MITIQPNGGIGNQLFQYAAGRALSLARSTRLQVDTWHYGTAPGEGDRPFVLDKLDLPVEFIYYKNTPFRTPDGVVQKLRRRCMRPLVRPHATDREIHDEGEFFNLPSNSVLIGYFQSLKYCSRYLIKISNEIDFDRCVSQGALDFVEKCGNRVCAIQVRRGDYIGNEFFDVVDFEAYYPSAIDVVRSRFPGCEFMIFSDDADWCAEQRMFSGMMIHRPSAGCVVDAVYIMSRCRAHIIGNSSYGWWGATLARFRGGALVVAPKVWFAGATTTEMGLSYPDWILL